MLFSSLETRASTYMTVAIIYGFILVQPTYGQPERNEIKKNKKKLHISLSRYSTAHRYRAIHVDTRSGNMFRRTLSSLSLSICHIVALNPSFYSDIYYGIQLYCKALELCTRCICSSSPNIRVNIYTVQLMLRDFRQYKSTHLAAVITRLPLRVLLHAVQAVAASHVGATGVASLLTRNEKLKNKI